MADLNRFILFAYPPSSPVDAPDVRPADDELNRSLSVAEKVIQRMISKEPMTLELPMTATGSLGIITLTRDNPNPLTDTPIEIPANTNFQTRTQNFQAVSAVTLSESARFIPVTLRSVSQGSSANIARGQTWSSNLALPGITITNQAFTGGRDAQSGDLLIEEAIFYCAKFLLQNRQFYTRITEIDFGEISEKEQKAFEMELPGAVFRHICGLISHVRKVTDFMPSVD